MNLKEQVALRQRPEVRTRWIEGIKDGTLNSALITDRRACQLAATLDADSSLAKFIECGRIDAEVIAKLAAITAGTSGQRRWELDQLLIYAEWHGYRPAAYADWDYDRAGGKLTRTAPIARIPRAVVEQWAAALVDGSHYVTGNELRMYIGGRDEWSPVGVLLDVLGVPLVRVGRSAIAVFYGVPGGHRRALAAHGIEFDGLRLLAVPAPAQWVNEAWHIESGLFCPAALPDLIMEQLAKD